MILAALLASLGAVEAEPAIIVTASREPVDAQESTAAATILDSDAIERLALPAVADFLRLAPGVAVATSGPRGTQTQVRIRGAEANHTLLFIDGIRFNDPAAGNEARFELLSADPAARIEIVRGPQSALWGSEAIGGVVTIESADPLESRGAQIAGLAEYGSLDTRRAFARIAHGSSGFGVAAAAGWQQSDGIDSFGGGGDPDGFSSFAANMKAAGQAGPVRIGVVGHWIEGRSDYDGTDPQTFRRADTRDLTRNRIGAGRAWAAAVLGSWSIEAEASYLGSRNRNLLGEVPLNATFGDRLALGVQAARRIGRHQLVLALEREEEGFRARDTAFGGATRQDRSRSLLAAVAEWRAEWSEILLTDLAFRHDRYSDFADATTIRAALLVRPSPSLTLRVGYGEGIAQPSFYDLHGFFPGSFRGNPGLRPERAASWETAVSWHRPRWSAGVALHSSRLEDEIVETFDPGTRLSGTANANGQSRRRGIEAWADVEPWEETHILLSWDWLDSSEPAAAPGVTIDEVRRPRHRASIIAHGVSETVRWGIGLSYVGARRDTDFDVFPARRVRLGEYLLASASIAWRVAPGTELYGRIENGLDRHYQDVVGYNVAGRTVHAGLRFDLGR